MRHGCWEMMTKCATGVKGQWKNSPLLFQQAKEKLYLRGSPYPPSSPEDMALALDLPATLGPSGSDHWAEVNQTAREVGRVGQESVRKILCFQKQKRLGLVGQGIRTRILTKLLLLTCNTSQSKIKTNFCCVSTMFHEPGLDTFILWCIYSSKQHYDVGTLFNLRCKDWKTESKERLSNLSKIALTFKSTVCLSGFPVLNLLAMQNGATLFFKKIFQVVTCEILKHWL